MTDAEPEGARPRAKGLRRREIIAALEEAAREQYPVEIERGEESWRNWVYGFVSEVGEQWVVLQSLWQTVYVDGVEVLRIGDITNVTADREAGYIERAVSALGRPESTFHLPERADTRAVLQAAADYATYIFVEFEAEDDSPRVVGHLVLLGGRTFDMQIINPRGVWTSGLSRWWYKDVTSVSFGNRYVAALEQFGDERPPVP